MYMQKGRVTHRDFFKQALILVMSLCTFGSYGTETCEALSDRLCREVWSSSKKGNVAFGTERVFLGKSPNSELSYAWRMNAEALITSESRLPKDLQKALRPLLKQLNRQLGRESHKKSWRRGLGIIQFQIDNAIKDVAEKRTFKRRPDLNLADKKEDDKTFDDYHELNTDYFQIMTEILNAKYRQHPNWKRVKRIFAQVKKDLILTVSQFPLDKETIRKMKKKVSSVELTLPYQDPTIFGMRESCSNTEVNAFYRLSQNKITVCAGYFNSLQSDGKIYKTLAHEVGHSIDAATLGFDEYVSTKLAKLLRKISSVRGAMKCEDWKKAKAQAFVLPKEIYRIPEKIRKLNECHVDRGDLYPLIVETLKKPSETFASQYVGSYANSNAFTLLSQPKIFKYESLIKNELFNNPKKLTARFDDQHVFTENKWGYFDSHSIFMQEHRCALGKENPSTKNHTLRAEAFEKALKETERLYAMYLHFYFSFEGRESTRLQEHNLSRPSFEVWADWIGKKAFERFLRRVPVADRKNMILAVNASECRKAGLNTVAPKLVKIEKKFANEEHPESRSRRLAVFVGAVPKIMGCQPGKEIQSRSQMCELK